MLQFKNHRVHRWYCTGDHTWVVVNISQGRRDCRSPLLIEALTTLNGDRRVLGSFLKIQEGKASVFGYQLLGTTWSR